MTKRNGQKEVIPVTQNDSVEYDIKTNTLKIRKGNDEYVFANAINFEKLKFLSGENQTYRNGTGNGITITANGNIGAFKELKIDGSVVDTANYEKTAGSTVISLKKSYLDDLNEGEHIVTFVYNGDNEISTKLTIAGAMDNQGKVEDKEGMTPDNKDKHLKNAKTGRRTMNRGANTGDAQTDELLFLISMLAGSVVIISARKKRF